MKGIESKPPRIPGDPPSNAWGLPGRDRPCRVCGTCSGGCEHDDEPVPPLIGGHEAGGPVAVNAIAQLPPPGTYSSRERAAPMSVPDAIALLRRGRCSESKRSEGCATCDATDAAMRALVAEGVDRGAALVGAALPTCEGERIARELLLENTRRAGREGA